MSADLNIDTTPPQVKRPELSPSSTLYTLPITTHDLNVNRSTSCPNENDIENGSDAPTSEGDTLPFSVFTKREKWTLIFIGSMASLFSPMASYIYFPAIPLLADDFNVSISLMNLTVTFYLVFQGISPMLWGPLADTRGRRPIYLACLALLSLTCVALALVPTDKWWLMLIFRMLQASGSASTVVVAYGVIADIATPAERGGFGGLALIGALLGPCVGPVLGGIFAGSLGWRQALPAQVWIFWFLCIFSGACLGAIFLFLPETLRSMVGDGSIPAPWWNQPLVPLIGPYRRGHQGTPSAIIPHTPAKQRINAFLFFREPDVVLALISNGFIYALFICIQASTSVLFQISYPTLTQVEIGLCFLPMGGGMFLSSLVTGRLLDSEYRNYRTKWEAGVEHEKPFTLEEESTFPIERARLTWAVGYMVAIIAVSIGYGWATMKAAPLTIPLTLQFAAGWLYMGQANSFQTFLLDLFPRSGSSVTAINNLVRCSLAAGVTSALNPTLDAMGAGWCSVMLGAICLVVSPLATVIIMTKGPGWRRARLRREVDGR